MARVTETATVGTQVPVDLAQQLRAVAERNERSVSAELRLAIRAHVEREAEAA